MCSRLDNQCTQTPHVLDLVGITELIYIHYATPMD